MRERRISTNFDFFSRPQSSRRRPKIVNPLAAGVLARRLAHYLLFILPKPLDFFYHLFGKAFWNLSASSLFCLHHFPYGLYHLWVGQRRDVAYIHEVRDRGNNPTHDFSRTRLGHVRDKPNVPRAGDFTDEFVNSVFNLFIYSLAGAITRFERNIHLRDPTS